jgi:alkylhydroperoxidase family enzyme
MPRIDVPDGQDPLIHFWAGTTSKLAAPAAAYSDAVYTRGLLSLREREAARIAIAQVNQCNICMTLRAEEGVDEAFYGGEGRNEREALAAEFATRFASDHLAMDDELWNRLHDAFSDDELVDLGLSVASWLALGRVNQVFGVDGVCRIPPRGYQSHAEHEVWTRSQK